MIRIFDQDFNFITEIDSYQSLIWQSRFHKVGEFQISVNQHLENVGELTEGRIVTSGKKAGIIAHVEETTAESGKGEDLLLVRGYDLKGLLMKRITMPPVGQSYDSLTANAETIMKGYVNRNAITTALDRVIPNLTVKPNEFRGETLFYQTRFKPLVDDLEKLSLASGLGWDVTFDNGYIFDVVEGKDLTTLQNVNPPVIFSADFDNVKEQRLVESTLDYKNVGIVAGQGEGAEREVVTVGSAAGLERNEVFIDARDVENNANLPSRGQQKLTEYAKVEAFETSILTYGPFVYGKDWDLGDIVTVQNSKKTRTAHVRVVEVVETTEPEGFRLDAVFGQPMLTIIDKVKRELDEATFEGGGGEPGSPGEPGKDGKTPVKGVDYFDGERGLPGVDGKDGVDGYSPIKGVDFFDGKDGVSVTHSWSGTTLNITSASGSTSADLKGDTGAVGEKPSHQWNGTSLRFEN
ncbi:MAG: hypothetical protein ABIR91_02535, partial [Candidatus Saccharimonadales bacterium]